MKVEKRDCFRRMGGLAVKGIVSSGDKRKMQRIDLRNGWIGTARRIALGRLLTGFQEKKNAMRRRVEIRGEVFRRNISDVIPGIPTGKDPKGTNAILPHRRRKAWY
jgi:hypothetical protein